MYAVAHRCSYGIVVLQAFAIKVRAIAAFEGISEVGLLGDGNTQICHGAHGFTAGHYREMVQVMAMVLAWVGL